MIGISAPPTLGGEPTANDSDANAMLVAHAYFAQTPGFVTARSTAVTSISLFGFVDDTSDPAGAGVEVAMNKTEANGNPFVGFFVAKNLYFELTGAASTITWTPLVRGGAAPIDFN